MEEQNYAATQEQQGSIVRGLIGAILGAVVGAALWSVITIGTERIWSIVGFLIGLIVGFGYDLLKGRKGMPRMVIVGVCVVLSVVVGVIAANVYWGHESYRTERDFIATATKAELVNRYCTEEELAELDSYPTVLRERVIETFEIDLGTEEEYFRLIVQDPEFIGDMVKDGLTSVLFALLGSYALILNGGKNRRRNAANAQTVNFGEASSELPDADKEDA